MEEDFTEVNLPIILSAKLPELCRFLASFPTLRMSKEECGALALSAVSGDPEAEFTLACVYDAAGESARARQWYFRSAARDYLPAMLQLCTVS
jgi:hypothetical protein